MFSWIRLQPQLTFLPFSLLFSKKRKRTHKVRQTYISLVREEQRQNDFFVMCHWVIFMGLVALCPFWCSTVTETVLFSK